MAEEPNLSAGREMAAGFVDRIYGALRPGAVFGEPVTSGDHTIITASEVSGGGGFGFGQGFGPAAGEAATAGGRTGGGGGGGGGGGAQARPVAVIAIGPDGVSVKPVVDVTKLALTGVTAGAAMAATLMRVYRRRR